MTEKVKIYYRTSLLIRNYAIAIVILCATWNYQSLSTTYMQSLKTPPGLYVVYMLWTILAIALALKTPPLVRALLRIPAVEFDGQHLLIRGWRTRSVKIYSGISINYSLDQTFGRVSVFLDGKKIETIPLSQIDGPTTLVRLLERISHLS